MTTQSSIAIYEIDGEELSPIVGDSVPKLRVDSHWNHKTMLVLNFQGKKLSVLCDELSRAIRVAEAAHR